jgi:MFS family permease
MWGTLKNKEFSIFVYSQTVSQFGDKLDYIALIGIIGLYPEARSPFLLSLLAIFMGAPVIIFGPIAGVLVDRWHKKKVMVICDSLRMLCAFLIPVVYLTTHNIYPVFFVVFFMFLFTLFFNAARSAIIPNLVTKKHILRANSVINFVGRGATFLGMLAGGLIVDWQLWYKVAGVAGWTVAFILDGITFGVSAVMLYLMKVKLPEPPKHEKHLEARGFLILMRSGLTRVWRELKHAVKDIFKEKNLGFAMSTILLMIIVGSVVYVLVIPTVQKELNWGTQGVGLLAAVGAIGLLVGAYLVGLFGHRIELKKLIIMCFVILSGALVIFPFVQNRFLFGLVIFLGGLAISPVFIGQDSLIHHYADEFVRGRMFSIRDWIFNGLFVVGALLIGSLATFAKKDTLFVIFGILVALLAILGWFIFARGKGTAVSQDHA